MFRIARSVIICTALATGGSASAQDLFSSTNSAEHSYSYLEVQYLLDTEASPPVLATLLVDLTEGWSFKAEFRNQDFGDASEDLGLDQQLLELGIDPGTVNVEAEVESRWISAGILYYRSLAAFDQTDWIAGAMYGEVDVSIEYRIQLDPDFLPFVSRETLDFNFQEFYIGLRRTFTPKLEGEATINRFRSDLFSETTADIRLVYRVGEALDIALSGNELTGDDEFYGVGLRYTW